MTVEVTENQEGEIFVLHLDGRLDAASSPILERKIGAIIDGGTRKLLLCFEGVDYLSSAGMRLLLTTGKRLGVEGGKMAVCAVKTDVMEVIKMAGFDRVLRLYKTEKEALAAL